TSRPGSCALRACRSDGRRRARRLCRGSAPWRSPGTAHRPPRGTQRARARRCCRGPNSRARLVRQIRLDLAGDLVEGRLVANGEVREHLAVDVDVGALEARHERAVAHAELAHRRVDARDPQRAELPFLLPAVAVGILPGLHQGLLRDPVDVLAAAAEAFGLLEDLLVARARRYSTLDSRHGALLRRVRQHGADRRRVGLIDMAHLAHVALTLGALLRQDMALVGARALDAAAAAHLEALGGAALGLHLRHSTAPRFSLTPGGSLRERFMPRLSLVPLH